MNQDWSKLKVPKIYGEFLNYWAVHDREYALKEIEQYFDDFKMFEKFFRETKREFRAMAAMNALQLMVDKKLAERPASEPKISCRKACSNCCHINVSVSDLEIDLIMGYAESIGLTVDWERLEKQRNLSDDEYTKLPPNDSRCVFLQADRTCGVYRYRPLACRKFFVVSDPAKCIPTGETAMVVYSRFEAFIGAWWDSQKSGSMSDMLLDWRKRNA